MKQDSDTRSIDADLSWLKSDEPEIYHLLLALNGNLDALRWLKLRGDGLFLFVEALSGAREAVEALQTYPTEKLIDLFDTISHCDMKEWLHENHSELGDLFNYVRGGDDADKGFKPKKTAFKRVAEILRDKYREHRAEDADGATAVSAAAALEEGAAADVGCLIGEMHLSDREYHKAIEAFSRAIANDPTPDAYAGRARAYRALAELDENAAVALRSAR